MGNTTSADQDAMKNLNCKYQEKKLNLILIYPFYFIVTEDELQKLYKNFSKLDKDKSGTLEP